MSKKNKKGKMKGEKIMEEKKTLVEETNEETVEEVNDTVEEIEETNEETVEEVNDTVEETKETNEETVEEVKETVEEVNDTVEEIEETNEEIENNKEVTAHITGFDKLYIRSNADKNSEPVGVVDSNDILKINYVDSTEDFYKVTTSNNLEGYCVKEYIKID